MRAEGIVRRGELGGVSIGYRVLEWEVQDEKGSVIDPDHVKWGNDDLTFVGTNWELLEVSICAVPADAHSGFRNAVDLVDRAYLPALPPHLADVRARMLSRQRMMDRQSEMPLSF